MAWLSAFEVVFARERRAQTGAHFTFEIYENLKALEGLRPEWDGLLALYPQSTVFSTWEWLDSWWRAFRPRARLKVVAVRNPSSSLVGLAPFAITETRGSGGRFRVLHLLGDGTHDSDNLDLPVQPGYQGEVTRVLFKWLEQCREWDICRFRTLPTDSIMGESLLSALKARKWKIFTGTQPRSVIELPQTWGAYLGFLSSKERGKVGLFARRLQRKYRVEICKCTGESELREALQALFQLHTKHWQARGRSGTLHVAARQEFYHELAGRLLARNRLDLWLLRLNDRIVAAQFGLRYGDTVFSLQEGYDPDYSTDSVGYVLRSQVLRNLIAEGIRNYDFLGGTDQSKARWGSVAKSYLNIDFARPRSRGSVYLSVVYATEALKAGLRKHLPVTVLQALRALKKRMRNDYEGVA